MDVLETITSTPTCETCRYFVRNDGVIYSERFGLCKRYPHNPVVEKGENDWCGEYTHA